jgi:hypothetical protein
MQPRFPLLHISSFRSRSLDHQAEASRWGELSALLALSAVLAERNLLAALSVALVS